MGPSGTVTGPLKGRGSGEKGANRAACSPYIEWELRAGPGVKDARNSSRSVRTKATMMSRGLETAFPDELELVGWHLPTSPRERVDFFFPNSPPPSNLPPSIASKLAC